MLHNDAGNALFWHAADFQFVVFLTPEKSCGASPHFAEKVSDKTYASVCANKFSTVSEPVRILFSLTRTTQP